MRSERCRIEIPIYSQQVGAYFLIELSCSLRAVYASNAFCRAASMSSLEKEVADEPSNFDLASVCIFVRTFWLEVASPFT